MSFRERLQQAARWAGAGDSQAAIAEKLQRNPQTVNRWFMGGEPNGEQLRHVARTYGVSMEWLESGEGEMRLDPNDLPPDELELLRDYRKASAQARQSIRTVVRALRKSVVAVALILPGFMAPKDAAAICHKTSCDLFGAAAGHNTDCISKLLSALRNWCARLNNLFNSGDYGKSAEPA